MESRVRTPAGLGGFVCALALCSLLLVPAIAEAEPQFESNTVPSPPDTGGLIPIRVGLYVLNLVALDEVQQTFTFTAYMTETWKDPRLAFTPGAGENGSARRYYKHDAIWFPLLQFDNSAAPRAPSGYLLSGTPDGTISYTEKFSVRVSSNMHLRAFPFDSQDLQIVVRPFTGQASRIVLSVEPRTTGISQAPYTPLPLWHTGSVSYRTMAGETGPGDQVRSHLSFQVHVVRNSEYYIYRIFLPLTLMVAVSWGVLWIPPADLNSQLLISVTTLLTLVAFSVALSNILPPVPYLTFNDIFFLDAFFFVMVSIGESLIVHSVFHGSGNQAALKARRTTRLLLPFLFVGTIAILASVFLR
jgi:hypothetical protein